MKGFSLVVVLLAVLVQWSCGYSAYSKDNTVTSSSSLEYDYSFSSSPSTSEILQNIGGSSTSVSDYSHTVITNVDGTIDSSFESHKQIGDGTVFDRSTQYFDTNRVWQQTVYEYLKNYIVQNRLTPREFQIYVNNPQMLYKLAKEFDVPLYELDEWFNRNLNALKNECHINEGNDVRNEWQQNLRDAILIVSQQNKATIQDFELVMKTKLAQLAAEFNVSVSELKEYLKQQGLVPTAEGNEWQRPLQDDIIVLLQNNKMTTEELVQKLLNEEKISDLLKTYPDTENYIKEKCNFLHDVYYSKIQLDLRRLLLESVQQNLCIEKLQEKIKEFRDHLINDNLNLVNVEEIEELIRKELESWQAEGLVDSEKIEDWQVEWRNNVFKMVKEGSFTTEEFSKWLSRELHLKKYDSLPNKKWFENIKRRLEFLNLLKPARKLTTWQQTAINILETIIIKQYVSFEEFKQTLKENREQFKELARLYHVPLEKCELWISQELASLLAEGQLRINNLTAWKIAANKRLNDILLTHGDKLSLEELKAILEKDTDYIQQIAFLYHTNDHDIKNWILNEFNRLQHEGVLDLGKITQWHREQLRIFTIFIQQSNISLEVFLNMLKENLIYQYYDEASKYEYEQSNKIHILNNQETQELQGLKAYLQELDKIINYFANFVELNDSVKQLKTEIHNNKPMLHSLIHEFVNKINELQSKRDALNHKLRKPSNAQPNVSDIIVKVYESRLNQLNEKISEISTILKGLREFSSELDEQHNDILGAEKLLEAILNVLAQFNYLVGKFKETVNHLEADLVKKQTERKHKLEELYNEARGPIPTYLSTEELEIVLREKQSVLYKYERYIVEVGAISDKQPHLDVFRGEINNKFDTLIQLVKRLTTHLGNVNYPSDTSSTQRSDTILVALELSVENIHQWLLRLSDRLQNLQKLSQDYKVKFDDFKNWQLQILERLQDTEIEKFILQQKDSNSKYELGLKDFNGILVNLDKLLQEKYATQPLKTIPEHSTELNALIAALQKFEDQIRENQRKEHHFTVAYNDEVNENQNPLKRKILELEKENTNVIKHLENLPRPTFPHDLIFIANVFESKLAHLYEKMSEVKKNVHDIKQLQSAVRDQIMQLQLFNSKQHSALDQKISDSETLVENLFQIQQQLSILDNKYNDKLTDLKHIEGEVNKIQAHLQSQIRTNVRHLETCLNDDRSRIENLLHLDNLSLEKVNELVYQSCEHEYESVNKDILKIRDQLHKLQSRRETSVLNLNNLIVQINTLIEDKESRIKDLVDARNSLEEFLSQQHDSVISSENSIAETLNELPDLLRGVVRDADQLLREFRHNDMGNIVELLHSERYRLENIFRNKVSSIDQQIADDRVHLETQCTTYRVNFVVFEKWVKDELERLEREAQSKIEWQPSEYIKEPSYNPHSTVEGSQIFAIIHQNNIHHNNQWQSQLHQYINTKLQKLPGITVEEFEVLLKLDRDFGNRLLRQYHINYDEFKTYAKKVINDLQNQGKFKLEGLQSWQLPAFKYIVKLIDEHKNKWSSEQFLYEIKSFCESSKHLFDNDNVDVKQVEEWMANKFLQLREQGHRPISSPDTWNKETNNRGYFLDITRSLESKKREGIRKNRDIQDFTKPRAFKREWISSAHANGNIARKKIETTKPTDVYGQQQLQFGGGYGQQKVNSNKYYDQQSEIYIDQQVVPSFDVQKVNSNKYYDQQSEIYIDQQVVPSFDVQKVNSNKYYDQQSEIYIDQQAVPFDVQTQVHDISSLQQGHDLY